MQKSALKSVNVQRTGKSILQMFAFSFFDGSHICRFLPILRPPTVPRSHFSYPKTKAFMLIISDLYLQIVTSASENKYFTNSYTDIMKLFFNRILTNCHKVVGSVGSISNSIILLLVRVIILIPLFIYVIAIGITCVETWNYIMNNNIVSTIVLCLLGFLFIVLILSLISIVVKQSKVIIFTRFTFVLLIVLLLGVLLYSSLRVLISKVTNFDFVMFREELGSIAGHIYLFIAVGYLFVLFFQQFSLSIYSRNYFTLYLRSFKSDGIYQKVEDEIKRINSKYNILTIANPKTFLHKTIGHTLYLPSINWKKFLEYYILRANCVIIVIDDSNGVMWEMFEHPNQLYKYIFIVPNKQKLQIVIHKLKTQSNLKDQLIKLVETTQQNSFIFTIENGEIIIDNINHLIKFLDRIRVKRKTEVGNTKLKEINLSEVERLDNVRDTKENIINRLEDLWDSIIDIWDSIEDFCKYNRWFNMCFYIVIGVFFLILGIAVLVSSIIVYIDEGNFLCDGGIFLFSSVCSFFITIVCFKKIKEL